MYSQFLIPLDGSASAEAAVDEVCEFAPAVRAVHLAFVNNRPIQAQRYGDHVVYADEYVRIHRENGMKYMKPFLEMVKDAGMKTSASVEFGDPVSTLARVSKEIKAEVIVVGGKRKGWLAFSTSLVQILPILSRKVDAKVVLVQDRRKKQSA